MSKTFRAWKIDDPLLLPVTVQEFVPKDHLARFLLSVVEVVRGARPSQQRRSAQAAPHATRGRWAMRTALGR